MQPGKTTGLIGAKSGFKVFAGLVMAFCWLLIVAQSARSQQFGGLLTVSGVNFNNLGIVVDSFDSSDPTKSLWQTNWSYNGQYYGTYTNQLRTAIAAVGTDGSLVNIGRAQIYGYVDTAAGGAVAFQTNASVGDLTWVDGGYSGIQPGHSLNDMNMVFADVALPTPRNVWYSNWLTLNPLAARTNIAGLAYNYVITNIVGKPGTPTNQIYWQLSSMVKGDSLLVNASNVVLYLPGGITMKSGDNFSVYTNSNVTIYTGSNLDTGNGLVNNYTRYAGALRIYGLPGCTGMSFGGNAMLTTWLYAPEASVSFNGGGSATYDVVGAFTCHDLIVNGHYNFHFDETLGAHIPPWIVSQPTNQIVQVGSNAVFTVKVGGILQDGTWTSDNWIPPRYYGNNFTLVLSDVQHVNIGHYFYIAENAYGSVTSAPASLVVYTDATPNMSIDLGSTNSGFQFDISGVTGLNYSVQASTNLIDWAPLATNVSPFTFVDTNADLFPQRFYRSVFTP